MSLFAVAAADIDTAGRSMDADLPVDWLDKQLADADARAMGPGHLSVRLSRVGNEIVVRGKARVSLHAPCGRCLSSAKLSIEADMSLLLKPARAAAPEPASVEARGKPARKGRVAAASSTEAPSTGGKAKRAPKEKDLPEYEFESEDADVDTYDGETVVLDDFVREAILLEMPIFPLCSEDCPGIHPKLTDDAGVGDAARVDPRLVRLGALRDALVRGQEQASGPTDDSAGAASRRRRK